MSGLVPDLSRKTWTILGADALSALGNGLILPFLVIYLRDARDFPIEQAALVLSTVAAAGLIAAPLTGWLIDRLGARRVLMFALSTAALASASAIAIDELWKAFVWAILFGSSISAMWPSAHSLMASVVEPQQRAAVYSVHFALLNAGIGVGAVLGGLLVDAHDPASFFPVFLLDAFTFVVYVVVLRFFLASDLRPASEENAEFGRDGWHRLVKDRMFMRIVALGIGLVMVGYAQIESSFPAYATKQGGISTGALGGVFAVNTVVIVGFQLVVLRGLAGRRRSMALGLVGLLWAACWLVTLGAGSAGGGLTSVLLFMAAAAVFAIGETFMQATLPALVNDLAPDDIRGRYNAAYSLTWSIGKIGGPALGGFLLGAGRAAELFLLLAVACGVAGLYGLRLGRVLPTSIDTFAPRVEASPD